MPKIYSVISTDGRGAATGTVLTTFDKKAAERVLDEKKKYGMLTGIGSSGARTGFQLLESDVRLPKQKKETSRE